MAEEDKKIADQKVSLKQDDFTSLLIKALLSVVSGMPLLPPTPPTPVTPLDVMTTSVLWNLLFAQANPLMPSE